MLGVSRAVSPEVCHEIVKHSDTVMLEMLLSLRGADSLFRVFCFLSRYLELSDTIHSLPPPLWPPHDKFLHQLPTRAETISVGL